MYDLIRRKGDRGKKDAQEWGRYDPEWTERAEPADERRLPGGEESAAPPERVSMPAPEPEHDEGP